MKAVKQFLILVMFICLPVISIVAQPKIILKLDDLTAKNGTSKFIPVMDYVKEKKIKAGLGAIGNGFDNSSLAVLSPYINATNEDSEKLFEIWHHGWDHIEPEFQGTSYAYQKAHFDQASKAVLDYLGIQMQTFGPPFNKSDATTHRVISENPNYKVFLFTNAVIPEVVSLQNRVDMENGVGNPDFNFFVDRYNSNSSLPFMILQGHPAMWNASKLDQLKQIIDFLISKGCEFINAYEMANNECMEEHAPQTPPDFSAVASASRQITIKWSETEDYKKSFVLERKQNNGAYAVIAYPYRSATSYTDNDVVDGHTYSYRIAAFNCFGNSPYSEESEVHLEKDQTQPLPVKSVSASSYLGNYKPENVIDEKLNTYWLIEGENHWLQLELHEKTTIDRINISFIKGNEREYEFAIETSLDGLEWMRAAELKSSGTTTSFEEFNIEDVDAKYIRYITGLNTVDELTWLADIQVRGLNLTSGNNYTKPDLFHVHQSHHLNSLVIAIDDEHIQNATVTIYNMLGKKVGHELVHGSPHFFNLSNYTPGIYLMKFNSQRFTGTRKIIIQNS